MERNVDNLEITKGPDSTYEEKLLKIDEEILAKGKFFNLEIISRRTNVFSSTLYFEFNNRQLFLKTNENIEINIKFSDILGFIPENKMPEKISKEIKLEIHKKSKVSDFFKNKQLAHINFFPKFVWKQCNCCGCLCCSCKITKIERRQKNIELLLADKDIEEIKAIFNKLLMEDTIHPTLNTKRKMLLYVNPVGGNGTAMRVWNQVKNIFALSDIEIEVFQTQYYQHAYDNTSKLDFRKYQGIICCSGDGIVHEVINAIFHRDDKEEFIHCLPIGVIPGGSANGYAKSICQTSGEVCNPENCSYIIVKGQVKEVDIMEIEGAKSEKKIYSFLSVAWGIIADCDLESETYVLNFNFRCRCCGPLRFSVYGAFRWMCLRNVFAALYYLPESSTMSVDEISSIKSSHDVKTQNSNNDNYNFIRENANFYYFWACNVPWCGETINCAPRAKLDDGFCDIIKMKSTAGKFNLLKQLLNQDGGEYYTPTGEILPDSGLEYVKTKCWRLIPKANLDQDDNVKEDRNLPRYYSIDGERYPIEPIQVKVLRKSLKIFCLDLSKY